MYLIRWQITVWASPPPINLTRSCGPPVLDRRGDLKISNFPEANAEGGGESQKAPPEISLLSSSPTTSPHLAAAASAARRRFGDRFTDWPASPRRGLHAGGGGDAGRGRHRERLPRRREAQAGQAHRGDRRELRRRHEQIHHPPGNTAHTPCAGLIGR